MTSSAGVYDSEAELIRHFINLMIGRRVPFTATAIGEQFDYRSGRADIVAICAAREVTAFEAKLTRWREALHQAYRNTCFAHRSYVLLPWDVAARAVTFSGEFEQRRVGICTMRNGIIEILHGAPDSDPIHPWLAERAIAHARIRSAKC